MKVRELERGCYAKDVDENNACVNIHCCCNKLNVYNWLGDISDPLDTNRYLEVRFKNTRKGIYENQTGRVLNVGDIVAVEASPGHDIGIVSATGLIAGLLLRDRRRSNDVDIKKIYRKARSTDIAKWKEAVALEYPTMLRTRELARQLNLSMKIGDVEYQGDKSKAIFYYIAEERVDFRELIKRMAEEFHIRVEMKQIGARQEAGRIGGIGPCGRELCCTTWLNNFETVSTNSARLQELSLNPQKLAGQCSKLKCCLNYEMCTYLDARRNFPKSTPLQLAQGKAIHIKNDIFRNIMYYEIQINDVPVVRALDVGRVKEIIALNEKGIFPDNVFDGESNGSQAIAFKEELNSDSITRFQTKQRKKRPKRRKKEPTSNNDEQQKK